MKSIPVTEYLRSIGEDRTAKLADDVSRQIATMTAVRLDEKTGKTYISNPRRLHLVCGVLAASNGDRVLEIGAGRGYCTIGVVLVAKLSGRKVRVMALDVINPSEAQAWGSVDSKGHWTVLRRSLNEALRTAGCSNEVNVTHGLTCNTLRKVVPLRSQTVVFIDGCHTFCNVGYDLLQSVRLMQAGGRIVMDDYGGSQGKATKLLVDFLHRRKIIEAQVIDMEPPADGPKVELDHCMVVVKPSASLVNWLESVGGKIGLAAVRKLAQVEIGLNHLRQLLARTWHRIRS